MRRSRRLPPRFVVKEYRPPPGYGNSEAAGMATPGKASTSRTPEGWISADEHAIRRQVHNPELRNRCPGVQFQLGSEIGLPALVSATSITRTMSPGRGCAVG